MKKGATETNEEKDSLSRKGLSFRDGETYWEARFQSEKKFEWYGIGWGRIKPILATRGLLADSPRVLILGSGNSPLSQHMYDDGVFGVVNVDFSPTVIAEMEKRHASLRAARVKRLTEAQKEDEEHAESTRTRALEGKMPRHVFQDPLPPLMRFDVADATDMQCYEDGMFDIVIDKATLDAVRCEAGKSGDVVPRMLMEVSRVLRPGSGVYVNISCSKRTNWLRKKKYNWRTENVGLDRVESSSHQGGDDNKPYAVCLCTRVPVSAAKPLITLPPSDTVTKEDQTHTVTLL
jgi:hypothetical protein